MPFPSWVRRIERQGVARSLAHSRPLEFGWGLEHLGLAGAEDPVTALAAFSDRAVVEADAFFDHHQGAAPEYSLAGDALTFATGHAGIDPANATVHARFTPPSRRDAPVVVVLGHWGSTLDDYASFAGLLARLGRGALRVALPYHDARMAPWMTYPEPICSPDLGLNLHTVRQAVCDVRRAIDWLVARGYRDVRITGVSFGAMVAQLVASIDVRVARAAFTFPTGSMTDFLWTSEITARSRETLAEHVDRATVERIWRPVNPAAHAARLVGRALNPLLVTGAHDLVVTPEASRGIVRVYRDLGVSHRWVRYGCGHYSIARWPYRTRWIGQVLWALR